MKNKVNREENLLKLYAIKNLPNVLLIVGLLIGLIDYALDRYVQDSAEWFVCGSNTLFLMFLGHRVGKFIKNMYARVYCDQLTGLSNRGYFYFRLHNEILKISSRKSPLSLVMIDIDNFKSINDKYGHLEGDKVIKNIAYILKQNIRKSDAAIRWGGDEFTLILPNTSEIESYKIADRIRRVVEEQEITFCSTSYKITVSIGIYTINEEINQDKFLSEADRALYKAKIRKNSVVVLNL